MPKIHLPIPETIASVTRPIVIDIIHQLLEITGLPPGMNVVYMGDIEKTQQLNSALSKKQIDDPNKFAYDSKFTLEVDEQYDPDRLLNEPIIGAQNLLIFRDDPTGIFMKPAYSGSDVTLTIKYRAANENEAIKWRDSLKMALGARRDVNVHDITYSYYIPQTFLYILKMLHTLRENVAGYGDTYEQYFAEHRHPRMTELTNLSGKASEWAMPETQTRVQGWFDFETPERGGNDGDADAWTTSFSYKFRYDRPVKVAMMYPLMVHNQLISSKFREPPIQTEDDIIKAYALATRVLHHFEQDTLVSDAVHRIGYSQPAYDEFKPQTIPLETLRVLTVLFDIDTSVYPFFLSMKNLGTKKFTPEILAFMKTEAPYMTTVYKSVFSVDFYRNEHWIQPTPLTIDADLNINATTPVVLRDIHHLRISLVMDFGYLTKDAITRMRENGKATVQILDALDPSLRQRGFMPPIINGYYITHAAMQTAIRNMRSATVARGHNRQFNTVQTLFLQSNPLPVQE